MGFSCAAMERCVQQNLYHERQMNYRAFAERPSVQQELDEAVEDVEVSTDGAGCVGRSFMELGSPYDQKQEGDVHGLEQASGKMCSRWGTTVVDRKTGAWCYFGP